MAQLTVIVGPGRREVVKVTPGTTLVRPSLTTVASYSMQQSQVLQTACNKHQLNPSVCALVYNGKEVDLALPYRAPHDLSHLLP